MRAEYVNLQAEPLSPRLLKAPPSMWGSLLQLLRGQVLNLPYETEWSGPKVSVQTYNWKRLWCPRTGSMSLADGGYLYVPVLQWPGISDAVPFGSIATTPCLVLLGEPGIGKSTTMKAEHASIEGQVGETGDATLWFDLRSYHRNPGNRCHNCRTQCLKGATAMTINRPAAS